MSPTLAGLLKLPTPDRVKLAMVLWESLEDGDRAAQLPLAPKQRADLDRRLAEHADDPASAVPWSEVRRKLRSKG
jgi:putative addiction module component (TIGR02574 family)